MTDYEMEIVLVVGTATLPRQIDLEVLEENLEGQFKKHEDQPGLYHRYEEDGLQTTFHKGDEEGGKYILKAYDSHIYDTKDNVEVLMKHNERLLNSLVDIGVLSEEEAEEVEVETVNHVGTAELNRDLQLPTLNLVLGLNNTEYEPEQFSFVLYSPDENPCVALIYANGKVVVPGGKSNEECKVTFLNIVETLSEHFPDQFESDNTLSFKT